jgi:hypothetical protein
LIATVPMAWSDEQDIALKFAVAKHGIGKWALMVGDPVWGPALAGQNRKQLQQRYLTLLGRQRRAARVQARNFPRKYKPLREG